jgi:hypothetical protein
MPKFAMYHQACVPDAVQFLSMSLLFVTPVVTLWKFQRASFLRSMRMLSIQCGALFSVSCPNPGSQPHRRWMKLKPPVVQ